MNIALMQLKELIWVLILLMRDYVEAFKNSLASDIRMTLPTNSETVFQQHEFRQT